MRWKLFSKVFSKHDKYPRPNTTISTPKDDTTHEPKPTLQPTPSEEKQVAPVVAKEAKRKISPALIYVSLFYLICCCLVTINFLAMSFWLYFFYSLKNDWRDINELITGSVTGISLSYSTIIWILLWIIWGYVAVVLYLHPIHKFWISSWRPRSQSVATRNSPVRISLSMSLINVLINAIIAIMAIIVAPVLLFLFAPQFFMAPVRLLETILPPAFLIAQLFYAIAGLPALIMWSSAISKASRERPLERSPSFSCSLRGIRVFSLLVIGACVLWGGAIFFSSLPLWFDSAHFLSGNELPPKPKLFAHRGLTEAGHPENSISAMKAALGHPDVFGIETDVVISFDGVPFCLHDSLLRRTTNIRSVFPDKVTKPAELFTMEELNQLELLDGQEGEKIPTFKELLELLVDYPEKWLIFDLRRPSADDHPFKGKFQDVIRSVIESVPNSASQIVLLNMDKAIKEAFPTTPTATNYEVADLLLKGGKAAKTKAESLKTANTNEDTTALTPSGNGLNLEYLVPTPAIRDVKGLAPPTRSLKAWRKGWSGLIKEVKASFSKSEQDSEPKPFWMCMYALSEKHLYSQAWCLGVDAVIANSVEKFGSMDEPIWWIPRSKMHYYPLIGFVGGGIFLLWVVIFILLLFFGILKSLVSCVHSVFCCCARTIEV